ncbi:hypothetical protein N7509_004215 [Penicillium cosmopolitanum]|uniref:Peptidase S8/S53 domain-containing protein n=1 Tax=Penicillium cosmopolitanum TaxID=1131564 RepID=A0A9W9W6E0_9EURO|nr:uncharacterized protein N7509_004215 [Penicillium cosmopolitanum]KAJ5404344.1 hypothetical protein N7509_004215 [Penicillium cosmopolitanum]
MESPYAIENAISHEVDIISMSWTIRRSVAELRSQSSGIGIATSPKKSIDDSGVTRLEKAIARAAENKNILMVCSAADDIELLAKDTLRYSAARVQIFRIGACNSQAQREPSEDNQTISYFLPGIHVPEARRPHSSTPPVYHDGSSIATALAAGLMSMILHCVRYMAQCQETRPFTPDNGLKNSNYYTRLAEKLKDHASMRVALTNIVRSQGSQQPDDPKQLPVYRLFREKAEKMQNANGLNKIVILEDLVTDLCSGISKD